MAHPVTPNVNGLLENISRSYKAVIDQHGNGICIMTFHYQTIYMLHRECGFREVSH